MEVNLVVLVGYTISIIAFTLACINLYKTIKISSWDEINEGIRRDANNLEIPVHDYVEMLMSSKTSREFHRKLKKYIKCKNK